MAKININYDNFHTNDEVVQHLAQINPSIEDLTEYLLTDSPECADTLLADAKRLGLDDFCVTIRSAKKAILKGRLATYRELMWEEYWHTPFKGHAESFLNSQSIGDLAQMLEIIPEEIKNGNQSESFSPHVYESIEEVLYGKLKDLALRDFDLLKKEYVYGKSTNLRLKVIVKRVLQDLKINYTASQL